MKTLLITGGSGLVGSAIKNIHKNYDYNFIFISSKDFDLTSFIETKKMYELHKPNYVIHLAGNVGGLFKNMNNKVEMLEKNILINYNVVKNAYDYNVEKLIACLSTCVFPINVTYPINEDLLHYGKPHSSNDTYSYSKRLLDIQCKSYRENFNKNFITIIPTNIYGINDNYSLEDGHIIPALIHKCFLAKKYNLPFIVKGTGKPLRQFIYSEDVAKIIMYILEYFNEESIIISPPEKDEISIEYIANIIAKKFEYTDKIYFDENFSDGQFKKTADNTKLNNLLNNFVFTNIEEGFDKTIKWFIDNYEILRK